MQKLLILPLFLAFLIPGLAADPCAKVNQKGGVHVSAPKKNASVASNFEVRGCSRTFESTVLWRLSDAAGKVIAKGHTQLGGGVDGVAPFSFRVAYKVAAAGKGKLEVYEEDMSDGEGRRPTHLTIPVNLRP